MFLSGMAGPGSHGVKHLRGGAEPCGDETRLGVNVPSGELTFCHGKWRFIVEFPIRNGDFPLLC